jgi:membrane-associated protease RseP (regulator of RpoE activity)
VSEGNGNGYNRFPAEVLDAQYAPGADFPWRPLKRRPLWPALILFLLTALSTLAVGAEFGRAYAENRQPFSGGQDPISLIVLTFAHPRVLAEGIPFSFTLLIILFAHEMGHYLACKLYGIDVSYPYFIPAPTLFGTFGAVIRIRSPITTRKALFDVGLAGPVAGFVFALPAMAYGIARSKVIPGTERGAAIIFGHPLLMRFFNALFHPHMDVTWLLLNPVGRAAWVGLFVTALNLLPAWQLDGGHIMFAVASRRHRRISIGVAIGLLMIGRFSYLWYLWGGLLLVLTLRFQHPPLADEWKPLDPARRVWALIALAIFALCFTPWAAVVGSR